MTNNLSKSNTFRFISSKDNDEKHVMHLKIDK